jgi:hypothetical protein
MGSRSDQMCPAVVPRRFENGSHHVSPRRLFAPPELSVLVANSRQRYFPSFPHRGWDASIGWSVSSEGYRRRHDARSYRRRSGQADIRCATSGHADRSSGLFSGTTEDVVRVAIRRQRSSRLSSWPPSPIQVGGCRNLASLSCAWRMRLIRPCRTRPTEEFSYRYRVSSLRVSSGPISLPAAMLESGP